MIDPNGEWMCGRLLPNIDLPLTDSGQWRIYIYISLSKTLCCREREFQVGWFSQWENDSWGRTSWYRTGAIIRVISFWIKKLEISGNGGWGGRRQISLFMQPKSIINKTWLPPRPSPLSLMTTNIQIRGHRAKYVYSFSYVLR